MGHRVVVIGAGVSGLTTAVRLLEAGAQVLVRTAAAPIGTASAVAGAMIGPVFGDPTDPAVGWARASDTEFRKLADQPGTGVTVRRGRLLSTPAFGDQLPPWAATVPGFRPLDPGELPAGFPAGMCAELPFADMPVYLGWLVAEVARLGGRIEQSLVTDLADAGGDIVVNCAGLGATTLAHDPQLTPVRGQHVIVDAPWLTDFVYEGGAADHWVGVMPHGRRVVLGGVAQPGDTGLAPDPVVTEQHSCDGASPSFPNSPMRLWSASRWASARAARGSGWNATMLPRARSCTTTGTPATGSCSPGAARTP